MKYSMRIIACSLTLFLPAIALAGKKAPPPDSPTAITPQAAGFLNSALDIIQQHALSSQSVDWSALRREAFQKAAGSFNPIDTYPAIYWALAQMNDPGSRIRLPAGLYPDQISLLQQAEKEAAASAPPSHPPLPPTPFTARRLPEGHIDAVLGRKFAHLSLPTCSATDNDGRMLYAADVRRIVASLSAQKPEGWILDLRGNAGGNMWPMLDGVGPILGDGVVGAFVMASGQRISWFYSDGKAGTRNNAGIESVSLNLPATPEEAGPPPPVAVLVDSSTAKSAEAVAIAFHGRQNTRFFGQRTAGMSTAVQGFPLSDGAQIYLTTAIDADRNGHVFPGGLTPDQVFPPVTSMPPEESDVALNAAEQWLASSTAAALPAPPPPVAEQKPAPKVKIRKRVWRKRVIIHQGS